MAMLAPVFQIIQEKIVKKILRVFQLIIKIIKQRRTANNGSREITANEQRVGGRG